jgi:hypothetical protein
MSSVMDPVWECVGAADPTLEPFYREFGKSVNDLLCFERR